MRFPAHTPDTAAGKADVVGLVALNVLTGTFNLVTGLEPGTLAATA